MADARAELEAKRLYLAKMREERKLREQERNAVFAVVGEGDTSTRPTMTRRELDELLSGCGIEPTNKENDFTSFKSSTSSVQQIIPHSLSNGGIQTNLITSLVEGQPAKRLILDFYKPKKCRVSISPKNRMVAYCKTTQTDMDGMYDGEFSMGSQELAYDDEMSLDETSTMHHKSRLTELVDTAHESMVAKVPELDEEEKRKILNDDNFLRFLQQQARIIERVITDEPDVFVDYINGPVLEEKVDKGEMLMLKREIVQEKVTECRMVHALDYSTYYPELLAVAYGRNFNEPLGPEGIVNIWNTRFKTSPEMTFHSTSQVTAMLFDEFQPNIIIGGCYSGQICIWDTRANKRNPVCRTRLSMKAHTQPIFCMKMVGSQNAHDLVAVSTDGRLCSWSVDNLHTPIESMNLICKSKKTMTALAMSFFHADTNNFVIVGEENCLYIADRYNQKSGITRTIPAHDLPVSSVDLHHVPGSTNDFSSLCLSGSMDFSVKLWDLKNTNSDQVLLLSLERKHKFYIVAVQWSPVHPAIFASASADGTLNLWNLNVNIETPIATVHVNRPIRKMIWTKNGQQLTVGDDNGHVLLYDVHESLYNVHASEFDDFAATLMELRAARHDQLTSIS